ncbi:MAG: hypothetical protein AB1714_11880 [Acidobacteriota bacterium]
MRSPADLRLFVNLPYRKYDGHPHWIPPLRLQERALLNRKRHPFYRHAMADLFIADGNRGAAGRIACIQDSRQHELTGRRTASFGFFEAADKETARTLLDAAEAWAKERECQSLVGPLNPSLNYTAGLLVDGFCEAPFVQMPYNPPEYADFIEAAGFHKIRDLYAWIWDMRVDLGEQIPRLAEWGRDRCEIREARPKTLAADLRIVHDIYSQAWAGNWGFVAPSAEEAAEIAAEMSAVLDPKGILFAIVDGRAVGCALLVPDINQVLKGTRGRLSLRTLYRFFRRKRIIDQGRLALLGIVPGYRHPGLYPLLLLEIHARAKRAGYRRVEFSWILDNNRDINRPAEEMGCVRYKTYRLYAKDL